jgi:hypothetical protein
MNFREHGGEMGFSGVDRGWEDGRMGMWIGWKSNVYFAFFGELACNFPQKAKYGPQSGSFVTHFQSIGKENDNFWVCLEERYLKFIDNRSRRPLLHTIVRFSGFIVYHTRDRNICTSQQHTTNEAFLNPDFRIPFSHLNSHPFFLYPLLTTPYHSIT